MLKAVIFDLDGLLVDSTPLQLEANRIFIESFGKLYLTPKSGREGMRIIDIIRDYKDIYDLPGNLEDLYKKRQLIYFKLVKSQLSLFPGVDAVIEKIMQKKIRMALATSGDAYYVKLVFQKFPQVQNAMEIVVTGDDVERGKPYPDIYIEALKQLKIKAAEAVVVEDSVNGILAAKAAKIQVIAIPNRNYPDADYSMVDTAFPDLKTLAKKIF